MFGNLHITGFHSGIALWLGLLLLVLGLAATVWHYRATNPPVSRTVRRVLGLGRGLAFAAALLMLISPAVQWVSTRRATPELLVFQDASLSMRRVEAGQPRWRRASDVLKSVREELGSKVAVRSYLFGTSVRRSRGELRDSTDAADQGTDLAQPLHAAMDSLISSRTIGVLLVSDGAYNRGADPAAVAGELGVPVWAVCVGDSTAPKDVAISDVAAPEVAFAGKPTWLRINLRVTGFEEAGKVKLVLKNAAGKLLGSKVVTLSPEELQKRVSLRFVPEDTGLVRLSIVVDPVEGEVSARNNRTQVFVRVLPRVRKILLVGGSPNADFGFLRRELAGDSSFAAVAVYEVRPGRLSQPVSDSLLRVVQGAVLVNFPAEWTAANVAERILGGLRKAGKPVAVFAQSGFDWRRLRNFYPALVPENLRRLSEQSVSVSLNQGMELHPLLRVSDYREETQHTWDEAAPVAVSWFARSAPDSSTPLLSGKLGGNARAALGWTVETGRLKGAVFAFAGFWRWRLAPIAYDREPRLYRVFVRDLAEWLAAPEHARGFEVAPERRIFEGGEPIVFRARLYDLGLHPVDDAFVTVRVRSRNSAEEQTLLLNGLGNGLYRGQIAALPSGVYRFQAVARAGDRVWENVQGRFAVKPFVAEQSDLRARPDVLRRMAVVTEGGFCVNERETSALARAIAARAADFRKRDVREERPGSWSVRATPWVLVFLLVVLALEWTVRRRQGLL